jgi:hypothetical protein
MREEGARSAFIPDTSWCKHFVRVKATTVAVWSRCGRDDVRWGGTVTCGGWPANGGWRRAVRRVGGRRVSPAMGPLCITHRNAPRGARSTGH